MKAGGGIAAGGLAAAAGACWWLLSCAAAALPEGDWTLDLASDAPTAHVPPGPVRELVERLASPDVRDAGEAWLAIGARYQSAEAFLADLRPAFYDPRPVQFEMTRERFSGGGRTFVYFSVRTPSSKGAPAPVHSVGQSLCYHLWQYEDASHSGFRGTFREWWAKYAPSRGLPGPRAGPAGRP